MYRYFKVILFPQDISTSGFRVCMKDLQPYDQYHDAVTINYLTVGCKSTFRFTKNSLTVQKRKKNLSLVHTKYFITHQHNMYTPTKLFLILGDFISLIM